MRKFTAVRMGWITSLLIAICSFSETSIAGEMTPSSTPPGIMVSTLAGSGLIGTRYGIRYNASFVMPFGVAFAKNRAVYVSDYAANRISVIRDGKVAWVAGSGSLDSEGRYALGSYHDGPAKMAEFSGPMGLAVGPDDAVYVADSRNHVIRKVFKGAVTTVVGTAGKAGSQDGARGVARLKTPMALTFCADGTMFIADAGNGVREVNKDGSVRTETVDPSILGVSCTGDPKEMVLFYSDQGGLHRLNLQNHTTDSFPPEKLSEGEPLGQPFQLFAIDQYDVLYSDAEDSSIKLLRTVELPFADYNFVKTIVGSGIPREEPAFKNGPGAQARVFFPCALSIDSSGRVVFADAGNHRIRSVSGFTSRHFINPDLSNLVSTSRFDRIAYLDDSNAFFDTLWGDSVGGRLEAAINATPRQPGARPYRVDVVRIDGSSVETELNAFETSLAPFGYRLVIVALNPWNVTADKAAHPEWGDNWPARLSAELRRAASVVRHTDGAQLVAVVYPQASGTAPWERGWELMKNNGSITAPAYGETKAIVSAARAAGIPTVDTTEAFMSEQSVPGSPGLFDTYDQHLSPQGRYLIAKALSGFLIRSHIPRP